MLRDATTDHFLLSLVEYFRTLQVAVADRDLGHEFGGGFLQYLFPFLAGDSV